MPVSKGVSTYAALVGAIATFGLAVATFLETFNELDPLAGLGPLAAAAAVLWKMIDSRTKQAIAQPTKIVQTPAQTEALVRAVSGAVDGAIGGKVGLGQRVPATGTTFQGSRAGVEGQFTHEIPAGSVPAEGGQ